MRAAPSRPPESCRFRSPGSRRWGCCLPTRGAVVRGRGAMPSGLASTAGDGMGRVRSGPPRTSMTAPERSGVAFDKYTLLGNTFLMVDEMSTPLADDVERTSFARWALDGYFG